MRLKNYLILTLLLILSFPSDCWGAAATMYVTPAGAGDKSGSTWANAMGLGEWETDVEGSAEAGDIYYVAGGTYTLTDGFITALDGTTTSPISIIGVKSGTTNEPPVHADWAFTTDRPLIAAAANSISFDDYWHHKNLRITTTHSTGYDADIGHHFENLHINNSSASANYYALYAYYDFNVVVKCELQSVNGYGLKFYRYGIVKNTYIHDSNIGFINDYGYCVIESCCIDTCATTGIDISGASSDNHRIIGNTVYTCATGISGGSNTNNVVISNLFDECTTPASWSAEQKSNYFDYNSWDGDKASNANVTAGNNSIDSDITLTDPANGDFTLGSGSACIDAGMQVSTNEGAVGDYKTNIGCDQDDVTAAGGGGSPIGWVAIE